MKSQELLESIKFKYSEWLEMAGENSAVVLNDILASLLLKQIESNDFYIKQVKYYENRRNTNEFTGSTKS